MTPDLHLDEDRLSALIDGEATPGDQQHALACGECRAKVEAWRATLGRLTDPVPPVSAAHRDVAIEAALAAASANPADLAGEAGAPAGAGPAGLGPVGVGAGAPAGPAGMSAPAGVGSEAGAAAPPALARVGSEAGVGSEVGGAAGTGGSAGAGSGTTPVSLAQGRRRGAAQLLRPRVVAAVAAALVIAGVAVAISHPGGSSGHPTAAPGTSIVPSSGTSAAEPGVPGTGAGPVNLGAFRDPAALVAALRDRAESSSSPAQRSPGASVVSPAISPGPCLSQARAYAGVTGNSAPALYASATLRGDPAQVFVFQSARGYIVAVVGVPGCRLLATAAY